MNTALKSILSFYLTAFMAGMALAQSAVDSAVVQPEGCR